MVLVRLLDTYGHPSSGPPAAIAAYGEGAVVVSFYQVGELEKAQEMTDPVLSLSSDFTTTFSSYSGGFPLTAWEGGILTLHKHVSMGTTVFS